MKKLTDKKVVELIDLIYCVSKNVNLWYKVLERLNEYLPDARSFLVYRTEGSLDVLDDPFYLSKSYSAGFDSAAIKQYMSYYRHIDVWAKLEQQYNPDEALVKSVTKFKHAGSYLPRQRIVASEFYIDFAQLQGIEDCLVLKLFQFGDCFASLTFTLGDKSFNDQELIEKFNLLARHIKRAASWSILKDDAFSEALKERAMATSLIDTYGLTLEEARVAIAYARPGDRESISEQLDKSLNTIKTHQKNVYKKLGLVNAYRKRQSLSDIVMGLETNLQVKVV